MRKTLLCGASALAIVVASSTVMAADKTADWDGLYLGATLSGVHFTGELAPGSDSNDISGNGIGVGLTAGWNMVAAGFVWGIEVDTSFSNAKSPDLSEHSLGVDLISTIRARVGMPVGDTLVYVTAGAGLLSGQSNSSGNGQSVRYTLIRPVFGAGVETPVSHNLTFKIEGLAFFGSDTPFLRMFANRTLLTTGSWRGLA